MNRAGRQRGRTDGFALMLIVALLALLAALAVALGSRLRVRGFEADTARHQAVARQNALLALDLAVSRLQRFAGPDARVTATADYLAPAPRVHLTGVWPAGGFGTAPLAWLVSGNEGADPTAITPASPPGRDVLVVGPATVGEYAAEDQVYAPLVDLTGFGGPTGRYAWWVGDLGVKASLGLADCSREIGYAPYDQPAMLAGLRTQMARGPTLLGADARAGFDPQAGENPIRLARLLAPRQMEALTGADGGSPAELLKASFHHVTAVHSGVLASTRTDEFGGLKGDLSLDPGQLGPAFAGWSNLAGYLEPTASGAGLVPPIRDDNAMRRRYRMTVPVGTSAGAEQPPFVFGVAPVLTELLLQFSIQRSGPAVQVKSRLYVGLWNPYTSALVPEPLRLTISGLPPVSVTDLEGAGGLSVDLQHFLGGPDSPPYAVNLPFSDSGKADTLSWLPGRLYSWTTQTGANPSADLHFYDKNISASGWLVNASIPGSAHLAAAVGASAQLTVTLQRADGTTLAAYASPVFPAFTVPDTMATAQGGWNFGFGFRLGQVSTHSTDRAWLVTDGRDPRNPAMPAGAFEAFDPAKGLAPPAYGGTPATATGLDHFLLFRSMGGSSNVSVTANNDTPVFELPRQAVVNPAGLQHLQVAGSRPFAVGNPWAPAVGGVSANAVFDRFFFSGLAPSALHPDLAAGEPLPAFHLALVEPRPRPSAPLELSDLLSAGAHSSRFLLQRGAFNVNSTSALAWQAVLSSVRFADTGWNRADIDNSASPTPTLGTQVAASPGTVAEFFADAAVTAPGFAVFRFPQSAQETFYAASLANGNAPSRVPFRHGVRGGDEAGNYPGFSVAQIATLAGQISRRVRQRLAIGGPFRQLEEFLSPSANYGGRSLLEDAILASGLNAAGLQPQPVAAAASDPGFCSLTLTQADLLGLLAPFLQTRSDTFLIRAYGESLNSATGQTVARAWCEATVQRQPAPFAVSDDDIHPSGPFGRRFRIVSFRWLDPTDV